jgi:hypothetical protein
MITLNTILLLLGLRTYPYMTVFCYRCHFSMLGHIFADTCNYPFLKNCFLVLCAPKLIILSDRLWGHFWALAVMSSGVFVSIPVHV